MELASDKGVEMGIPGIPSELWISLCSESEDTSPAYPPSAAAPRPPSPRSLGFWTPSLWVPVRSSHDALWLRPGSPSGPCTVRQAGEMLQAALGAPLLPERISKSNSLRVSLRGRPGPAAPFGIASGV